MRAGVSCTTKRWNVPAISVDHGRTTGRRDRVGWSLLQLQLCVIRLLGLGTAQVRPVAGLVDVESVLVVVGQAFPNEVLAALRYLWLGREDYFARVENCLVLEYGLLTLIVAERFGTEEQLEENDANAPYVHFVRYLRAVLVEALWRLVPIGADTLRRELDLF